MDTLEFEGLSTATFSVDMERRTMRGVVIPWGKIGRHSNGNRWRFARGSLKYGHAKYIKLNEEHVHSARFGRAIAAEDTDEGFVVTFKVYDGPHGDRALAMARDGQKTGLSPEVDIDTLDMQDDPENPGVRLVTMANLTAVGFVKNPAFDDSRLISVVASYEGASMKCTKCGLVHADGVTECVTPPATTTPTAQPVTFSADQFTELMAKFNSAGTGEPVTQPEQRPTVNPTTTPVAVTQVTEALPYKFSRPTADGEYVFSSDNEHNFHNDLLTMARAGDDGSAVTYSTDAGKRVMGLIQATFAGVTTSDVNELSPTAHRPDMWVDQRDYRRPIWNIIGRGNPPAGGNSFDFPKFSSASGLVNDHTEGTEPTSGTYVTTDQTVTPTALSGKASLTREAWTRPGNPATSGLIYNQMVRGYWEGLETAAATFLNTLTAAADMSMITGATAGSAPTSAQLKANWESNLMDLQFIRGYDFTAFVLEKNLYKAFGAAVDSNGRSLYPMIAPQNANGTSALRFTTLNLGGVVGIPSWALTATAGSVNNSWLFDPATVYAWATAPERLEFPGTKPSDGSYAPVAWVDLAIWGWKAFANTDIGGVRQVTYDTTA